MANKSERRRKAQAAKKAAKEARMRMPGGQSAYAAKRNTPLADRLRRAHTIRARDRAPGPYMKPRHGEGWAERLRACVSCEGDGCIDCRGSGRRGAP